MRQEVFLGDGRRIGDHGIGFAFAVAEAQSDSGVEPGASHPTAVIPSFLPDGTGMDAYIMSASTPTVEIQHDVNAALVANRESPLITPFTSRPE